jgi:predicted enzyme related to lactoylglutathione lyase
MNPERTIMPAGIRSIIYPVKDLEAAKTRFTALTGREPAQDSPYYVGFSLDGLDVGLDPNGHRFGVAGPVVYWHVADIRSSLAEYLADGGTLLDDVKDVGGGMLVAVLTDADGNTIGLSQEPSPA